MRVGQGRDHDRGVYVGSRKVLSVYFNSRFCVVRVAQ